MPMEQRRKIRLHCYADQSTSDDLSPHFRLTSSACGHASADKYAAIRIEAQEGCHGVVATVSQ